MLREIARELPDVISASREQAIKDGLKKTVLDPMAKQLIEHVSDRAAVFAR